VTGKEERRMEAGREGRQGKDGEGSWEGWMNGREQHGNQNIHLGFNFAVFMILRNFRAPNSLSPLEEEERVESNVSWRFTGFVFTSGTSNIN
jgi:hypothetical protein